MTVEKIHSLCRKVKIGDYLTDEDVEELEKIVQKAKLDREVGLWGRLRKLLGINAGTAYI